MLTSWPFRPTGDREHEGVPALMARLPCVYYKLNQAWNERDLPDDVLEVEGGERIPRDLPGILDLL